MDLQRSDDAATRGFRLLLVAGIVMSFGTAVLALFAQGIFVSTLGLKVSASSTGFDAIARLYGGVVLSLGVGYVLAAIDPLRHRGLLVVLFLVPVSNLIFMIAEVAAGEMSRPKGSLLAALSLAYSLLYFRLYPKPDRAREPGATPPDGQPGEPHASPGA